MKEIDDGPADLAREKAAAVADGIPLVAHYNPPPEGDNAVPAYDLWWKTGHRQQLVILPNYADWMSRSYAYTPAQIAKAQSIIDSKRALFDLMHQAVDKPDIYVQGGFDRFPMPFDFSRTREAGRELSTETYLLARSGQYTEAIAMQTRGLRMARQVNAQSGFLQYLSGDVVEGIAVAGFDNLLYMAGPNASVDGRVRQAIQTSTPGVSFKDCLIGALPDMLSDMDRWRTYSPGEPIDGLHPEGFQRTPAPAGITETSFSPEEHAFIGRMIDATEARLIARTRILEQATDWRSAAHRVVFAEPATIPWSKSANLRNVDYFQRMANTTLDLVSQSDLPQHDDTLHACEQEALAAAKILSLKAKTGKFPAALPSGFLDPYSGKPLGYRLEGGDGFVVYSVGPGGHYDGGKRGDWPKYHESRFRYPALPPVPVPVDLLK